MELTAAEPRRKGLVQLFLDGEPAVKVDGETFALSKLRVGDELSDEQLHELIQASDARRAREKALYLLEHRNHSKKELGDKLIRAQIPKEAARAAAEHLEELGLVDDERFARDYARELFERKRYGPARVRQELRLKGIDSELIQELLAEHGDEDEALENIQQVLEKKYPLWQTDEKVRRRAFAALQRLGYPYELIRRALASAEDDG